MVVTESVTRVVAESVTRVVTESVTTTRDVMAPRAVTLTVDTTT